MLSTAAVRAALREAVAQVRGEGLLLRLGPVADAPGVLRRLRGRVASWTRQGRDPRRHPAPSGGLIEAEEWAVFARYREILRALRAEDPEGFAHWASRLFSRQAPPTFPLGVRVTILDPIAPDRATWRAIRALHQGEHDLRVTLPFDPEPTLAEAYSSVASVRDRLLGLGFEETAFPIGGTRPSGLLALGCDLFREDAAARPLAPRTDGLTMVGAPRGEGEAAVIARRVKGLIEAGAEPESILILFRRRGDSSELVRDALTAWGLPAASEGGRGLSTSPAVAALGLAIGLEAGGWEADGLVALLRHGQVRPEWAEAKAPLALAFAASAVRDTRAFRDRARIREALRRHSAFDVDGTRDDQGAKKRRAARARVALPVFDRLAEVFDGLGRPATWFDQVEKLRTLAADLGIGTADAEARAGLEHLFDALDDHGELIEGLGRREAPWGWAEFAGEVRALVRDLEVPAPPAPAGCVRLASVDEAEGTLADHVILADLAEGTFPARESIDPTQAEGPEAADGTPPRLAFAREMLRFLRVVGSAGSSLTLTYPTTDEKGQSLLAAGFLDDARRLFAKGAEPEFAAPIARLDPALMPADLAGAPGNARARAVALAGVGGDAGELRRLARLPAHRKALLGAAAALKVARARSVDREFGPFDGRLADAAAIRRISEDFSPERHAFSASQLESLALCPFQFFQKYVLRLEPIADHDELDEDLAARGSLIHRVLEDLHVLIRDDGAGTSQSPPERVAESILPIIEQILDGDLPAASDIEAGLRLIQAERLRQVGRRYINQFENYAGSDGRGADCRQVEVGFGEPGEEDGSPPLVLGGGPRVVHLRGKIDRIDFIAADDGPYFRVIDYKSGAGPGRSKIAEGLALQLPLYALAVERNALAGQGAAPLDAGYWELKSKGYQAVVKMTARGGKAPEDWEASRERTEEFVLALVDRLREGAFPVHPRAEDCTRLCDYRATCRIAQARSASKTWADAPRMEPPP